MADPLPPFLLQPYDMVPINDKQYVVTKDIHIDWIYPGNGKRYKIVVYKGYITDFASVPRIFWNIIKPDGTYRLAAIAHDFLYGFQGCPRILDTWYFFKQETEGGDWVPANARLIKSEVDDLFKQLMLEAGTAPNKAGTMHLAVKLFGGGAWNG